MLRRQRAESAAANRHLLRSIPQFAAARLASSRVGLGDRLTGAALALIAEVLLVLVVLSMGLSGRQAPREERALVSMTVRPPAPAPTKTPEAKPKAQRETLQQPRAQPDTAAAPAKQEEPPRSQPIILMSRSEMAALDIAKLPRPIAPAPGKARFGPADAGVPGDSKRVGTAPGGQPMYAASWYREPYDDELSGYLSTANGPGWALIACRTVANFRVEDCVGLDEFPERSNLLRAVLAAAWQFQVRPPRVGGVSRVGDWVRIRIEYSQRRR